MAASRHLEVERKFDVDDSTATPSFDGLAGIAEVKREPVQTLQAVYFDTLAGELSAHRIALRRRTGGTDAGWHLKLPAGPAARTELRVDLDGGDDDVPEALRDVVRAIIHDRPLAVIVHITNHRTIDTLYGSAGYALAEFCDDRVTASAAGRDAQQRWREWELELNEQAVLRGSADGRLMARLSGRLLDAGAAPSAHASKLARALGRSGSPTR